MKRFKSIADWLKTNPSQEEQDKVLILIHRGATSQIRREVWEKERYLHKLSSLINHFKRLGLEPPKNELDAVAKVKKEVEALKKELPVIPKKEKKVKEEEKKEELAAQLVQEEN